MVVFTVNIAVKNNTQYPLRRVYNYSYRFKYVRIHLS